MNVFFAFIGSGFSYIEMIFIFMAILVLFGPRKLPEVFRTFGNIMGQLRTASREFKSQVMDVEQQIKAEVRDIEESITKEAKGLENSVDGDDAESEYSFEDDPYHADMHDGLNDDGANDDPYHHADHHDEHHDVWEDDHSDYDCPEDRARRELDAAAESLVNGNESNGSGSNGSTAPSATDLNSTKLSNAIEGTVPHEIPPGLETPVRRTFPDPTHPPEQDALANHSAEPDVSDTMEADETAEESRDATA